MPFDLRQRLSADHKVWIRNSMAKAQSQAARPVSGDLDRLARIFGTDKSSRHHDYTKLYAHHLPGRRAVTSLLEIGVGGYESALGGHSLRMWERYYPRAHVVGLDIDRKVVSGSRITFVQGSQDDPALLRHLGVAHGPFDVIIDDGSHVGRHIEASFRALFEFVRPGGWYVIEDLAVAYHPDWEGGPPGTAGTQAELLKGFVDHVLRQHWDQDGTAFPISAMHVYDEIAFIQKGASVKA